LPSSIIAGEQMMEESKMRKNMRKIIKNNLGNFLIVLLIFLIVVGWIFSGWPRLWQKPPIPPKIEEAKAADTTLRPNGDGTVGTWTSTAATFYTEIDNDPDAADDDTTYVQGPNRADASMFVLLSDTPADFGSADTIEIKVKHKEDGTGNDVIDMYYQIFQSDEATVITAETTATRLTQGTYTINAKSVSITGTNDKTTWDGARIRLRQDYTRTGAADTTSQARVTAIEVNITYTLVVPPATWKAAEDTPITNVNKNENIRLRFLVANTGSEATNYDYLLEYAPKVGAICGSFIAVPVATTTEPFEMTDSPYITNGEPTTAKLTIPPCCPTFVPGRMVEDPSNSSGYLTLPFENYTEIEFVFQATTNATNDGSYCFRLTNAGTILDEYPVYPELQIAIP